MQFAAFHTRGAEGLLCWADRGSLSAGVSVVKGSLCAQEEPQCGLCGATGSAVNVRRSENYSDAYCFRRRRRPTEWSILSSPSKRLRSKRLLSKQALE